MSGAGERPTRPRLLLIGGPDVDQRIPLMERLCDAYDCVAAGSEPALAERFAVHGFPYHGYRLTRRFNLAADALSIAQLERLIERVQPSIVHCFDTKPCVVGRLAAARARVPVILGTLPGLGALYTYDTPAVRRRRAVFKVLHRWSAEASDGTIFQNRDDLQLFVLEGVTPPARSFLIRGSGVDVERFPGDPAGPEVRAALRRDLGLPADAELVIMVSRLIRAKGVLDLARAAPLLARTRPQSRILLVGPRDPETLDALDDDEMDEVTSRLTWLGPRDDVPRLLAAADVFVFPSYYREGVPRVLIEAALAALPTVTTDSVGCREVVVDQESGLLVPPQDPDQLARQVARLLADRPLARRLAAAGRTRVRQRFALEPIAAQHRDLYRRFLGETPPAPPAPDPALDEEELEEG